MTNAIGWLVWLGQLSSLVGSGLLLWEVVSAESSADYCSQITVGTFSLDFLQRSDFRIFCIPKLTLDLA